MGDDHDGNAIDGKARRIRSVRRKRLMRLSTRASEALKEPTKLDQNYNGDIGVWVQKLQANRKADELAADISDADSDPKCRQKQESHMDIYGEETDHILEALHKLKRWMNRMWRWGQCYTQYCYPSFRTVEYYRKAKENQKRRKKCLERKANRMSKKPQEIGNKSATAASPVVIPNNNSKDEAEVIEMVSQPDTGESCPMDTSTEKLSYSTSDLNEMVTPLQHALNDPSDDSLLSWTEYISKQFNDTARTMAFYLNNDEEPFQVTMFFKWVFYLFLPAVLLLGVHYVFLKRKYKSLSGKLKRIKDESNFLVTESNKLESMLINTEQLTMSMSTKESRAQAVADFTRLSESLMNSKKEINQMKTEKAALLEELKRAKRKRDEAHRQYSSLTHGTIEHDHSVRIQPPGVR